MKHTMIAAIAFAAALGACKGGSSSPPPPADVAPVLASLSATPSSVISGTPTGVTWTWAYSGDPSPAPTCSIDHGVGVVTSGASTTVTLSADTTFTLTCTNAAGTDTAETAIAAITAPAIGSFTATPLVVGIDTDTSVAWSWTFVGTPSPAPGCTIDNGVGEITNGASTTVRLTADTTFTLTCASAAGEDSAQVSVSAARAPELASFSASPSIVTSGTSTVTWSWSYANTPSPIPMCWIDHGVALSLAGPPGVTSGTSTIILGSDTVFTLTCTNDGGSDTAQTSISVCPIGYAAPTCSTCATGYQDNDSNGTCEHACSTAGLSCTGHRACTDASGTAACVCATGYTGADCQTCDTGFHECGGACCPTVAHLALGTAHSCAATAAGAVKCWGSNEYFQLGHYTGTLTNSHPLDVALADPAVAIAAGYGHTCAVTTSGAWCWGFNNYGQLGAFTAGMTYDPVPVSGLAGGVQDEIACGAYHTCAVTSDGGAKCWGWDNTGQLGDGTTCSSGTSTCTGAPADVVGLTAVTGLSAGGHGTSYPGGHSCVVTGGAVSCWGDNRFGQIGDGTLTERRVPTAVSGLGSGMQSVASGYRHNCALTLSGGVKCWGTNADGQLGDGTTIDRATPVDVQGLTTGVAAIAPGGGHSCALTAAGGVKCWGANGSGQLGDGTTTSRLTPVDVVGLTTGVVAVATGLNHSCAVAASGDVKCWGYNERGKVGVPITLCGSWPCPITTPADVTF